MDIRPGTSRHGNNPHRTLHGETDAVDCAPRISTATRPRVFLFLPETRPVTGPPPRLERTGAGRRLLHPFRRHGLKLTNKRYSNHIAHLVWCPASSRNNFWVILGRARLQPCRPMPIKTRALAPEVKPPKMCTRPMLMPRMYG